MSDNLQHRVRRHALAIATAVMVGSLTAGTAAAGGRVELAGLESAAQQDRFIVKYRSGSGERTRPAVLRRSLNAAAASAGADLSLKHLRRLAVGADVVLANRKLDGRSAESLMRQIAANPNVEYVEVDALMQPVFTPNDTRYPEQWHYFEAVGGVNLPLAWDKSTGSGIVVAVLDTGITNHTELNANLVAGYDMISDPTVANDGDGRDPDPSDPGDWTTGQCGTPRTSSWHGTHVAGTIAAVTNNSDGVAGVAFNAKIQPVRVLGTCGGFVSDIADGIIWASGGAVTGVPANATPAEVINMSLGGGGACGTTYQAAINDAVGRGTVVVVAAGNGNSDVSGFRPANCSNVIAVASTTRSGGRSSFSNFGTGIDVAAPGSSILSTLNTGTTVPVAQSYAFYNGTSMAAPHVAGIVALMQADVVKTPAQVEANLKTAARPLPIACPQGCGAGIVDAHASIEVQRGNPPPPPPPPPPSTRPPTTDITCVGRESTSIVCMNR